MTHIGWLHSFYHWLIWLVWSFIESGASALPPPTYSPTTDSACSGGYTRQLFFERHCAAHRLGKCLAPLLNDMDFCANFLSTLISSIMIVRVARPKMAMIYQNEIGKQWDRVCVCVWEREREWVCVCVCVCVRERERERESESACVCEREKMKESEI